MTRISYAKYRTFYPPYRDKGREYRIEYRQISRTYDVYASGQLLGKFCHSDLALLAVLQQVTGFKGDEVPPKHKTRFNAIQKACQITYQGLVDG